MSLHPHVVYVMPQETERVAQAAFPRGNLYMQMRDTFGQLYDDRSFSPLFSTRGRPAEAPARLALVTVMQFAEGLSDRQAADAVRSRIDWKYALSLKLTDPGFDSSVLSEFRTRLITNGAEAMLLETLLTRFREQGLLQVRGKQRTASTHVLAAVRALNRLELVGETLWHALNVLATIAPEWLRPHTPSEWIERYAYRCDEYRLSKGKDAQQARAETIGTDGIALLTALYSDTAPGWLREVPAIETLRRVWMQNYLHTEGGTR